MRSFTLLFITVTTIICCSSICLNAGMGQDLKLSPLIDSNRGEAHTYIWYDGKGTRISQMVGVTILPDGAKHGEEIVIYIPTEVGFIAKCLWIRDGDTIVIEYDLTGKKINVPLRYIGINTPGKGEKGSQEATEENKKLTEGKFLYLWFGSDMTDDFHRLLAYVLNDDGVFVNAYLVNRGFAESKCYDPNCLFHPGFSWLWEIGNFKRKGSTVINP